MNPGPAIVSAAALGCAFLAIVATVLLVAMLAAFCRWLVNRRHKVGPDALRLLEELDGHLDDFAADDPEVAAGFARLRAAVREERKGGGTS